MPAREIAVDDRGRCNLAKVRKYKYTRYFVTEAGDGTLTLTPAITLTPAEVSRLRQEREPSAGGQGQP